MHQSKLNIESIRAEFPVLHQQVNGKPLIYFDNAATTQKPKSVIHAIRHYYEFDNANIHRGIHTLAERATAAFEDTRVSVQQFINSREKEEIIFTKGTTESVNLVASSFAKAFIKAGDEIIISGMEHHSNIVPWQIVCEERGAVLKVIPVLDHGELDMEAYQKLLSAKTKMVACVYVSNALGTINPIKKIIEAAHSVGAKILVDGAQAVAHLDIDVQELDCDFFAFSAHKLYGPTGVGILYGKRELLDAMPPYQSGGEMIKEVRFEGTTYNEIPYKFEAGTPNIADVIGFKSAIDFINNIGKIHIRKYENELLEHCTNGLKNKVTLYGTALQKVAVCSFVIKGMHHFDAGMMLDAKGIAVRTGHHCTQPLMERFGIEGTVRASFAIYNTKEEIDVFLEAVEKLVK
ncbi:MAG: cysteine desulfurase [Bacteroidota bacterium]|nr:cysteine desulfurase [Bacteroidota bacterium]